MEHKGTSFCHSCVKMPVDPYSRQPTPSYERPSITKNKFSNTMNKERRINFAAGDQQIIESDSSSPHESMENFLDFLESIPDYTQVYHLSNEQFKQKIEYLKKKQQQFLQNLQKYSVEREIHRTKNNASVLSTSRTNHSKETKQWQHNNNLELNGKKCLIEESRSNSPILFSSGTFLKLVDDQDLLTYRRRNFEKDKETKSLRNAEIYSANKSWSSWSESKSNEYNSSDGDASIETKSLPPNYSKEWHPTVPKPFSFTLREDAEKYMSLAETEAAEKLNSKKKPTKKRKVRKIPLSSKIPLYDKLLAEKEERSRIVREESALNLMSQVRPFKLECDRRAWRFLSQSSPEICMKSDNISQFKAKPVPRNIFGTGVYDRMLEDEYYRQLKKKIRAAELLKSSSLPPSMARRERINSARTHSAKTVGDDSATSTNFTPTSVGTTRFVANDFPSRGTNLAAILRCRASREKLEREIRERMEEERREQEMKFREILISRKPAWKALRSSARNEPRRDIDIRATIRREEAREQAERHRMHMEMMLNRVTQIPTLFERYSQSFQSSLNARQQMYLREASKKKIRKQKRQNSSSADSYVSNISNSRPDSGSLTSSSGTVVSLSNSSGSHKSGKTALKINHLNGKRKVERGPLKVSINETAELIEDNDEHHKVLSDCTASDIREGKITHNQDDYDSSMNNNNSN